MKTRILSPRIKGAARLLDLVHFELGSRIAENQINGHNESDVAIVVDENENMFYEVEIAIKSEKRTLLLFTAYGIFKSEPSAEMFINQAIVEAIMKLAGPQSE